MELKFLHVYQNLEQYNPDELGTWEKYMITPFWKQISEWAPFPVDFMKPAPITNKQKVKQQMERFHEIDFDKVSPEFNKVVSMLPIDDDDPMTIAFYPSDNNMEEGVFGTCVWGNIVININPINENAQKWLPYVFAHEYHHRALGFYWYCVKGGSETKGNFLEYMINEGQADNFAQSVYPSFFPSWHKGVSKDCEHAVWKKFEEILYTVAPTEQFAPYMFGDSVLGIPTYAGYYFGYNIVKAYMDKHTNVSFSELIQTPHQQILYESGFSLL